MLCVQCMMPFAHVRVCVMCRVALCISSFAHRVCTPQMYAYVCHTAAQTGECCHVPWAHLDGDLLGQLLRAPDPPHVEPVAPAALRDLQRGAGRVAVRVSAGAASDGDGLEVGRAGPEQAPLRRDGERRQHWGVVPACCEVDTELRLLYRVEGVRASKSPPPIFGELISEAFGENAEKSRKWQCSFGNVRTSAGGD